MILIIADSHDNLPNLTKALRWAQVNNVAAILHAGDLTNAQSLSYLTNNWSKPIYLVQGNGELYDTEELVHYEQIINLGRAGGIFDYQGLKIGLCHEPKWIEALLTQEPELVFYGHTHKPWEEKRGQTRVINPGNLDGSRYPATMASYEPSTKELKLILVDDLQ